jgi:hypothetical protein
MRTAIRTTILALALAAGIAPAFAQTPPPVPALPDTERRTTYSISASTCACAVGFQLYGDSTDYVNWLEVFVGGILLPQPGNWTITSPTGPIATIARPITDAVLTFTTPQTGTVQIVGARRPRRTSQFQESQPVPTRNFNVTFSDITATLRELWDKTNDFTGRAVRAPPGETLTLLPAAASRANMGACFDNGGNLVPCVSIPSSTFSAGAGILFTGTNPTAISNNIQAGAGGGLVVSGTNPIVLTPVQPPGGRLSLVSGQSRPMADVSGGTAIYYVPDVNPTVPVPNGTAFQSYNIGFGSQLSANLSAAHILQGSVYDAFIVLSGGLPVACVYDVGWLTGSRAANVATHGAFQIHNTLGFWSNVGILTHCWGGVAGTTDYGPIAADNALYVGGDYASANGQFSHVMRPVAVAGGTNTFCTLFNAYNPLPNATCKEQDSNSAWTTQATATQAVVPCDAGSWAASFTASISTLNGGTMTVTVMGGGAIVPGQYIINQGAGAVAGATIVLPYGTNGTTGVGGTGTYRVAVSQTVGSEAMVGSNLSNRINFVDGLANSQWTARLEFSVSAATTAVTASTVELGLDQTVATGGSGGGQLVEQIGIAAAASANWGSTIHANYDPYPTVGFHYLQCLESGANSSYFGLDFAKFSLTSSSLW